MKKRTDLVSVNNSSADETLLTGKKHVLKSELNYALKRKLTKIIHTYDRSPVQTNMRKLLKNEIKALRVKKGDNQLA